MKPIKIKYGTVKLYHQTDEDSYKKIVADRMRPGKDGIAGGGVYFAETPEETAHKAHHKGVMLECKVVLGKVKEICHRPGDTSIPITFESLTKGGHDSVKIVGRTSGVEYVVYNSDQVLSIRRM